MAHSTTASLPPLPRPATAQGKLALGYVAWNLGGRVEAQIDKTTGRMVVNLNKAPIKQGKTLQLGKLVTIEYERPHRRHWWSGPRVVEITVRPFIKIVITQAWLPPAAPGAKESFAPYLEV